MKLIPSIFSLIVLFTLFVYSGSAEAKKCNSTVNALSFSYPWVKNYFLQGSGIRRYLFMPQQSCLTQGAQLKLVDELGREFATAQVGNDQVIRSASLYFETADKKSLQGTFFQFLLETLAPVSTKQFLATWAATQIDPNLKLKLSAQNGLSAKVRIIEVVVTPNTNYRLEWNQYTHFAETKKIKKVSYTQVAVELANDSASFIDLRYPVMSVDKPNAWRIPGAILLKDFRQYDLTGALDLRQITSFCDRLTQRLITEKMGSVPRHIILYGIEGTNMAIYQVNFCLQSNPNFKVSWFEKAYTHWEKKLGLKAPKKNIKDITIHELVPMINKNQVHLLDTRSLSRYQLDHIPRAHQGKWFQRRGEILLDSLVLPKNKLIVLYADDKTDVMIYYMAYRLQNKGFKVKVFPGGMSLWRTYYPEKNKS